MNKKTQAIIGVVALGAVGLYLWNKSKKDKVFANAIGMPVTFSADLSMSKEKSFSFSCPPSPKVYTATNQGPATPGSPRLHGTRAQMIAQACGWIAQHPEYSATHGTMPSTSTSM